MEQDTNNFITPVTAIRLLHPLGGSPIEQAVPEDYSLAVFVLRAMGLNEEREIAFVLKGYLPIQLIPVDDDGNAILVEPLQLVSRTITLPNIVGIQNILENSLPSISETSLDDFIKNLSSQIHEASSTEELEVKGLLSDDFAKSVALLLQWPALRKKEPYSVILPSRSDSTTRTMIKKLKNNIALAGLLTSFRQFIEKVETDVAVAIEHLPESVSTEISKLSARIEKLEESIEKLEAKLHSLRSSKSSPERIKEIQFMLQKRKTALQRDIMRREKIKSQSIERVETTRQLWQTLLPKLQLLLANLESFHQDLQNSILIKTAEKNEQTLLIPLFIVGLLKKDELETIVFPPSQYTLLKKKRSRKSDFLDPFQCAHASFLSLCRMLEERIDDDISLMKHLRSAAESNNLLMLSFTRKMLRNGTELLRAEGILKRTLQSKLHSLLDRFPERVVPITDATFLATDHSVCKVRFHILDYNNRPIKDAKLVLDGISAITNSTGIIELTIPLGSYTVQVAAENFKDYTDELTINSSADVVVPIRLEELSREEQLFRTVDKLKEQAERISQIREHLLEAFEKHGDTFLSIPPYRAALEELLRALGYEPKKWIAEATRKRGMLHRLLKGDIRTDSIRRAILQIGEETKKSGGIIRFSELMVRLESLGWSATAKEVEEILASLQKEGLIQGISTLENGVRIVSLIPTELTDDPKQVLTLAAQHEGVLTQEDVVVALGWSEQRAKRVLELLVERGIARLQKSYSEGDRFWFPGLRKR